MFDNNNNNKKQIWNELNNKNKIIFEILITNKNNNMNDLRFIILINLNRFIEIIQIKF